ncbi:hypothetical protein O181_069036 [Austropuccinia psidii MF-1]|uniref:Uncharacterized protein n=1 Tax=Austropuccinia psidii MF-1 TaxID=1389203 RepID=A0A9Q3EVZ5_9BASI|nr:hypothetical protein [Austropuccinia psidii MF-1]
MSPSSLTHQNSPTPTLSLTSEFEDLPQFSQTSSLTFPQFKHLPTGAPLQEYPNNNNLPNFHVPMSKGALCQASSNIPPVPQSTTENKLLPKDNHTFNRADHHRPKMMSEISNLLIMGTFSMFICSTDKKNFPIWKSLVGLKLGSEVIESNLNNPPHAPQWHFFVPQSLFFEKHLERWDLIVS